MCPGCYKQNVEGYCLDCRKLLFSGAKLAPVLSFDKPKEENQLLYQEKTKRLSISGVQLKYSLRLEGKELVLAEKGGQYILKPVPPSGLIGKPEQAPENEHLTMQIASQVFGIQTAANALIYFKEGTPAYLTKRFDIKQDGTKFLQEDMSQVSGRTRQTNGENFKYEGSYEDIGNLVRQYVAAYPPVLENFFRLVLFNYILSNGDAHLKNFSLIQTTMGDYTLAPAYDLMCTVLHTPHEADTALDLYEGDKKGDFYSRYGYYGQPEFRTLAEKLGIQPVRAERILTQLLTNRDEVLKRIGLSFLNEETKTKYRAAYLDKIKRMGMTKEMIAKAVDPQHPNVYAVTYAPNFTKLVDREGNFKVGFFEHTKDSMELEKQNKYTFVENNKAINYRDTGNSKFITVVDGDDLVAVEHTSPGY